MELYLNDGTSITWRGKNASWIFKYLVINFNLNFL